MPFPAGFPCRDSDSCARAPSRDQGSFCCSAPQLEGLPIITSKSPFAPAAGVQRGTSTVIRLGFLQETENLSQFPPLSPFVLKAEPGDKRRGIRKAPVAKKVWNTHPCNSEYSLCYRLCWTHLWQTSIW